MYIFAIQNIHMNFSLPNQAVLKELWLVAFPSILDTFIYIYKYLYLTTFVYASVFSLLVPCIRKN